MSGAGRYGSGPGSDSYHGLGGRREVPFGPEISWPYGFRQLDPESRDVLESAYGTGGYQLPAMDDYGDPGYSDPSYEGPGTPYDGPAFPGLTHHGATSPGYSGRGPGSSGSSRAGSSYPGSRPSGYQRQEPGGGREIRPAAGPREILPGTGSQRALGLSGSEGSGGYPKALRVADPEQWYGNPRLDDGVARDGSRDPRLEGVSYGELRYDQPSPGEPGYDEPPDDESWYGAQPGFSPAPDRIAGDDRPRGDWDGPARRGPQLSAGRAAGSRSGGQPGSSLPSGPSAQVASFLAAPVGVLTPPSGTRVDALHDEGMFPGASRPGAGAVRSGRGLDGPEITSSWPAQPTADDLDSYQDFWRDDVDEEYTGLFGDREAEFERADAKRAAARRRIGRRRGGSNDRRLWLGLGGVIVIAAAAIAGIIKFEFPSHGGPAHTLATPAKIGSYLRTGELERETDVAQLRDEVIKMSSGQASGVVSAVYKSGNSAAGNNEQIIMLIQGHLANADPASSITTFTQKFPGAHQVSAGTLGGQTACVQEGAASSAVAMCVWFDNDSFGEIVSPTMSASALAKTMLTVRPSVELRAAK